GREDYHGRVRPERVEEAERGEIHASLSVDARHPSDGPRRDAGSNQSVDVDRLGRSDFDFHVGTPGNKKNAENKNKSKKKLCGPSYFLGGCRTVGISFPP